MMGRVQTKHNTVTKPDGGVEAWEEAKINRLRPNFLGCRQIPHVLSHSARWLLSQEAKPTTQATGRRRDVTITQNQAAVLN